MDPVLASGRVGLPDVEAGAGAGWSGDRAQGVEADAITKSHLGELEKCKIQIATFCASGGWYREEFDRRVGSTG